MTQTQDDSKSFTVTAEENKMPAKGIISEYSVPASVKTGAQITVAATVKNTGEQNGNFFVRVDRDGSFEEGNTSAFALAASASATKTISFTAQATAGTTNYVLRLWRIS